MNRAPAKPWPIVLQLVFIIPKLGALLRAREVRAAGRCPHADPTGFRFAGMLGPVPLARCASLRIIIVISPAEAAPARMARGLAPAACSEPAGSPLNRVPRAVTARGKGLGGRGSAAAASAWAASLGGRARLRDSHSSSARELAHWHWPYCPTQATMTSAHSESAK